MIKTYTPPKVAIRIYTALINQTGSQNPTVNVLNNTTEGIIVWSRVSAGIYNGVITGKTLKENGTTVFIGSYDVATARIYGAYYSTTIIRITLKNAAGAAVDGLLNLPVEIRLYDNN